MTPEKLSHADRLMAELRGKLASISTEASRGAEECVSFSRKEPEYAAWLERHANNGHVLYRDAAKSKTAHLHVATCPEINGKEEGVNAAGSKVGCPTKPAAMRFARLKQWRVVTTCDKCPRGL